jgi:hypothetical protein
VQRKVFIIFLHCTIHYHGDQALVQHDFHGLGVLGEVDECHECMVGYRLEIRKKLGGKEGRK